MPKYTYKCNDCKESFTFQLGMDDPKPDDCTCGGSLKRDYSGINIDNTVELRDPTSSRFWKKGKSDNDVSDVLEDKKKPY